ncbi:MAG TPA: hypothetical protein VF064_07810 [Pyrinomonadaceae bacterium]
MSGKSSKGIGGLASVAALTLFASCAEAPRTQDSKSAPPARASNMNTSSGPAGSQNAAGAEPLQGSRFGTRLTNQSVGAGINDNTDTRGSNKAAGGAKKSNPAGRKKR